MFKIATAYLGGVTHFNGADLVHLNIFRIKEHGLLTRPVHQQHGLQSDDSQGAGDKLRHLLHLPLYSCLDSGVKYIFLSFRV